jgi:hypothetical protein
MQENGVFFVTCLNESAYKVADLDVINSHLKRLSAKYVSSNAKNTFLIA